MIGQSLLGYFLRWDARRDDLPDRGYDLITPTVTDGEDNVNSGVVFGQLDRIFDFFA